MAVRRLSTELISLRRILLSLKRLDWYWHADMNLIRCCAPSVLRSSRGIAWQALRFLGGMALYDGWSAFVGNDVGEAKGVQGEVAAKPPFRPGPRLPDLGHWIELDKDANQLMINIDGLTHRSFNDAKPLPKSFFFSFNVMGNWPIYFKFPNNDHAAKVFASLPPTSSNHSELSSLISVILSCSFRLAAKLVFESGTNQPPSPRQNRYPFTTSSWTWTAVPP